MSGEFCFICLIILFSYLHALFMAYAGVHRPLSHHTLSPLDMQFFVSVFISQSIVITGIQTEQHFNAYMFASAIWLVLCGLINQVILVMATTYHQKGNQSGVKTQS